MSRRFRDLFKNRHVILPVIHAVSADQTLKNVELARDCRCDGAFLINHSAGHEELVDWHARTVARFPDFWIGINSLGMQPEHLFASMPATCSGLWTDNAGIDERQHLQPEAESIDKIRLQSGWSGLYFGGVAFKYQRPVEKPGEAARIATRYMDVVTTSGAGTGMAARLEKIKIMKEAIGDFPLAIASGITPENVTEYLPFADCYLVASGIESSFTELDADRVRKLVRAVRSW